MRQLSFSDLAVLYRAVLRANRTALPPPLRALGDGYAADEFRRHLRAKTTAGQWGQFAAAWRDYVERLACGGGAGGGMGGGGGAGAGSAAAAASSSSSSSLGAIISDASGDLPREVVASLSREQRRRLEALKRAAEALARGGGGGEGEDDPEEGGGDNGGGGR
jgi:hypothetical protein